MRVGGCLATILDRSAQRERRNELRAGQLPHARKMRSLKLNELAVRSCSRSRQILHRIAAICASFIHRILVYA